MDHQNELESLLVEAASFVEQPKGLAQAERLYERALNIEPTYQAALTGLGIVLVRTGRGPLAMKRLQRVQKEYPGSPGPLRSIAVLIRISGYVELGERYFQQLLESSPAAVHPYIYLGLGEIYAALGRHAEVKAQLRKLTDLPHIEPVTQALLWMEAGDVQGILGLAQRTEGSLQTTLWGMACELQSNWQQASQHYYAASCMEQPSWICMNALAAMWLNAGNQDTCKQYLVRAESLAPMATEVQITRARYMLSVGYREDARLLLQRIITSKGHFYRLRKLAESILRR